MSDKYPKLSDLDMTARVIERKDYENHLAELQLRILRVQQAYFHEKRRAIIVFEGWDASGKGGTIRRMTEQLDPRGYKVWPIAAPKPEEQGRHYLYRFWTRLPEPGTIALFDRSWYGRVLVERVEGFAKKEEWHRAYHEIREFERMLSADGVRIIKLFFHITQEEQLRRFAERLRNPYKRWKLTEEDIRNREKWTDYEQAIGDMFEQTSTRDAPWVPIAANQKWHVRVRALEAVLEALTQDISLDPPPLDPRVQLAAAERLGLSVDQVLEIRDAAHQGWGSGKKDKKDEKKKKK